MNCVPFYLHGERRICTKAEFLRRFNLATGGAFKGIDLKQFEQDYEVDLLATQGSEIEYLCEQKLLELSDGKLKITRQGIPISNSIIGRLI